MEQDTDNLVAVVLCMVMLVPVTVAVTLVCVAIFGGAALLVAPVFYITSVWLVAHD